MSGLPVLLFLDVSGGELMVIALVVFLVFGPDKMPEIARKFGKAMNQMKKASNDLTREFKKETSGFGDELYSAKNKLQNEIDSVSREISSTKSKIMDRLTIDEVNDTKVTETTTQKTDPPTSAQASNFDPKI